MNFLLKKRGDRKWDLFLHTLAIAGLMGLPLVVYFPDTIPLVWLALVSIPANSPLSPIIPTAFEPVIMVAAKYSPALLVTGIATAAYMYMEFVNWHIYAWVLSWEKVTSLRDQRWVRWSLDHFSNAPFWVTVFFALTPLPFWAVRCLAILEGYPIRKFMAATAVGRFPRFLLYAWAGEILLLPTSWLIAFIIGSAAIVIASKLMKGEKLLADTVLDSDQGGAA